MAASLVVSYLAFTVPDVAGTAQYARPTLPDVAAGTWTPSTGGDLAPMLDETSYDDSDYIYSAALPVSDTAKLTMSAIEPPNPGTVTIRIRGKWAT